jgi:hypothetical protein
MLCGRDGVYPTGQSMDGGREGCVYREATIENSAASSSRLALPDRVPSRPHDLVDAICAKVVAIWRA